MPERVLPETPQSRKELGIWAAKAPKPPPGRALSVGTIKIPLPDDLSAPASERADACKKASEKTLGIKRENYGANIGRMLPDMQACWWYLSWRYCMRSNVWPDSGVTEDAERLVTFADRFMMGDKTATRCFVWEEAFKDQLNQVFDWHLRGWYLREHKTRTP